MTALPGGSADPPSLTDKRWAQRANELQFTELAGVRATAEQWRNGLAALTGLLAITAVVISPGLADKLDPGWRLAVGVVAAVGLLALLFGTFEAMHAAFGVPGDGFLMTGERLRQWESQQTRDTTRALATARASSPLGSLCSSRPPRSCTRALGLGATPTVEGSDHQIGVLRDLGKADTDKIQITSRDGAVHLIPINDVRSVSPS